jgi:hypothetical protein
MRLQSLPFAAVDWTTIPIEERAGTQGTARSRSFLDREVRVRMVEYSSGYVADHWCTKGHIVLCVRGEFLSEHQGGAVHRIREGMVYIAGDGDPPHRSSTETGATLFIVD